MGVRRQINRYRTTPGGYDFLEVLKKGKAFHRASGRFEMVPFETPKGEWWSAESPTLPTFEPHKGTKRYRFNEERKRWEEVDKW